MPTFKSELSGSFLAALGGGGLLMSGPDLGLGGALAGFLGGPKSVCVGGVFVGGVSSVGADGSD